jgi:hypothetical protein
VRFTFCVGQELLELAALRLAKLHT